MKIINGKIYHTREELDKKINESILKNAEDLAKLIKNKKIDTNIIEYV